MSMVGRSGCRWVSLWTSRLPSRQTKGDAAGRVFPKAGATDRSCARKRRPVSLQLPPEKTRKDNIGTPNTGVFRGCDLVRAMFFTLGTSRIGSEMEQRREGLESSKFSRPVAGGRSLLFLLILTFPTHGIGQTLIEVDRLCDACSIQESHRTTIGASSDPNAQIYGLPTHITELQDGSFLLFTTDGGPPTVFDSAGGFLRRIGGRGRGPSEFVFPSHGLEVPGDSLLILDPGQGRALIVAPDGHSRSVLNLPTIMEIDLFEWPRLVGVADVRTIEDIGRPFHILDFSGPSVSRTAVSVADRREILPMQLPEAWSVRTVDDSLFWAIGGPTYTLELWDIKKGRQIQLRRPLREYDPVNRFGAGGPLTPPPARVASSLVDQRGLIWVFLQVPRSDWRDAWRDVPFTSNGEVRYSDAPDLMFRLYQTRVDVIDPTAGTLVHTAEIPTLMVPFTRGTSPAIAKLRLTEDGTPLVEISSLALMQPPGVK